MVFRGRPSRACERCRARRLKCDLQKGTCGQCVRACVACSGYRDTQQLRIENESHSVAKKVSKRAALCQPPSPESLPLSIELQALNAFFIHYATGTSKSWNFLTRYYYPMDKPDHLTMAIEALSCAYLWHVVDSEAALAIGRQKYVSALRLTNKALDSPHEATKNTILLLASLLLDLFEKITDNKLLTKSWTCHVDGAFALVKLRGLEHFQTPAEIPVLKRLINHHITTCVASASLVPDELIALRDYVAKALHVEDYTLQLSQLAARYAKFRSNNRTGMLSKDSCIEEAIAIESQLQALEINMPRSWQYSTTILDYKSERALGLCFDTYTHREICSARNFIRVIRIQLIELIIGDRLESSAGKRDRLLIEAAHDSIETLSNEICASVPQYTDCQGPAGRKLFKPEKFELLNQADRISRRDHIHTLHHLADSYSLIFPLFVVGQSTATPQIRVWIIKQLHFIASHFLIRNAKRIAHALEQETSICPWDVYAMLGGYAYNA